MRSPTMQEKAGPSGPAVARLSTIETMRLRMVKPEAAKSTGTTPATPVRSPCPTTHSNALGREGDSGRRPLTTDTTARHKTSTVAAQCTECCTPASVFYCAVCLSERIISHHVSVRRVDDRRRSLRRETERLLGMNGVEDSAESQLPGGTSEDNRVVHGHVICSDIDRRRVLRAAAEGLIRTSVTATDTACRLRRHVKDTSHALCERRAALSKRRDMLSRARALPETKAARSKHGALESAASESIAKAPVTNLSACVEQTREQVALLERHGVEVAQELARVRAILAREAFSLFMIAPPPGTLARIRAAQGKSGWTGTLASRTQRSRERYVPGAFVFDRDPGDYAGRTKQCATPLAQQITQPSKARKADTEVQGINVNDWTIMSLVLPLASDLKRFPRAQINGAIAHTVHLLHLMTTYLGLVLPFVISAPAGVPSIRPNSLWGSGTKQSLYLSSATYSALVASEVSAHGGAGIGAMGASMISTLGASTMSTLESFVQLPSGSHLPWARNSNENAERGIPSSASREKGVGKDTRRDRGATPVDEKAALAGKQICTALTMLAYDVAYIAHLQGSRVDIVHAAGSPLRLLSNALSSTSLGGRAHATFNTKHHIGDLAYSELDFSQVAQVHEPGSSAAAHKGEGRSPNDGSDKMAPTRLSKIPAAATTIPSQAENATTPMLDGSYVDARKVAESIVDVRKARTVITTDAPSSIQPKVDGKDRSMLMAERRVPPIAKARSTAVGAGAAAGTSTKRPGTLDFLHAQTPLQRHTMTGRPAGTNEREAKDKRTSSKLTGDNVGMSGMTQSRVRTTVPFEGSAKAATPPASSRAAATTAASAGTILFNGKEITGTVRVKTATRNTANGGTRHSDASGRRKDEDDEDWAVV